MKAMKRNKITKEELKTESSIGERKFWVECLHSVLDQQPFKLTKLTDLSLFLLIILTFRDQHF